jgi:hypothetical protein
MSLTNEKLVDLVNEIQGPVNEFCQFPRLFPREVCFSTVSVCKEVVGMKLTVVQAVR